MFGEISLLTWLGAALIFAVGGAAGYLAARQSGNQYTRRLQEELEQARTALSTYRNQVDSHFQKTSELFSRMTEDYRQVYQHLAQGAQTLCGEKPELSSLNLPASNILPEAGQESAQTITLPDSGASEAASPGATDEEPSPRHAAADSTREAAVAANDADTEAESLPETDTDAEPEEIHLGVESASGIDFTPYTDDGKTPPIH